MRYNSVVRRQVKQQPYIYPDLKPICTWTVVQLYFIFTNVCEKQITVWLHAHTRNLLKKRSLSLALIMNILVNARFQNKQKQLVVKYDPVCNMTWKQKYFWGGKKKKKSWLRFAIFQYNCVSTVGNTIHQRRTSFQHSLNWCVCFTNNKGRQML